MKLELHAAYSLDQGDPIFALCIFSLSFAVHGCLILTYECYQESFCMKTFIYLL